MNSETMKALLPALAAAMAAMPDPKKNRANTHFGNRYADLGAVLECVAQPLADNGLVLTQTMRENVLANAPQLLVTRVWETKSGEWIESAIEVRPEKDTPQGRASALTYARRYAIKALFGLADVDDDGNAGSAKPPPKQAAKPAPAKPAPAKPAPAADPKAGRVVAPGAFDFAEDAIAAIQRTAGMQGLSALAPLIKASNFEGADADQVRAAYSEQRARFATGVSTVPESTGGDP